jgi:hypothetical protein
MGDVAVCDAREKATVAPLRVKFAGTLVGIFGERTGSSLSYRVKIDGKEVPYKANAKAEPSPVWPTDTRKMGGGNLFCWAVLARDLAPGEHELVIEPVFEEGQTQLRIESICYAE